MKWKGKKRPPMPGHRISGMGQLALSILAGMLLACAGVVYLNAQLDPMVLSVSKARFSVAMERTLCATLEQEMTEGPLVELQYDPNGRLAAVTTQWAEGNRLRSRIIADMVSRLSDAEDETITVPVGSLSGLTFLSGLGWEIPVRLLGVTNVDSGFDSTLVSTGINQTLHTIRLNVRTELILLLPGGPCRTEVLTSIPVAETVLMGEVPESYSYFSQFDSAEAAADAYNDWAAPEP